VLQDAWKWYLKAQIRVTCLTIDFSRDLVLNCSNLPLLVYTTYKSHRSAFLTDDRRLNDRVSSSCTGGSLAVFGHPPEILVNSMLSNSTGLIFDDAVRDANELFGYIYTKTGRRAGILTQMMPRLHSMTDKFRIGTVLTFEVSIWTFWSFNYSQGTSRTRKEFRYAIRIMPAIHALKTIRRGSRLGKILTYPVPPTNRRHRTIRCLTGISG
jgi:hypothetical protein